MEIPDTLLCQFSARVRKRKDKYIIDIPQREITLGDVRPGETYRIACINWDTQGGSEAPGSGARGSDDQSEEELPPPVRPGDQRDVEIVDLGEKGDGIATVERGYILVVPGTSIGDHVTVEVTNSLSNVGFATVIEHHDDTKYHSTEN